MSERLVLSACIKSGDAYRRIADHVIPDDMTAQGRIIWEEIAAYYGRDPAAVCCVAELLTNAVKRKVTNPKHIDMFVGLLKQFSESDVSPANVAADFVAMKRELVGQQLAVALTKGSDTTELLEEYARWGEEDPLGGDDGEDSQTYQGYSAVDLAASYEGEDGLIKMYPKNLNDQLDGGLLRGHHVVVYARPEMGKTMFLVNAMFGWAQQGLRVLYVCNEEPVRDTIARLLTRFSGMNKFEVLAEPEKANEAAFSKGYDKVMLRQLHPGTPKEIERILQDHRADVLVVDQLRNLNVKAEGFTQQLEGAAKAVRTLGQRNNCLAVSVTQAGASAEGKQILGQTDVDSSNTGIPATCDLMIGIGGNEEDVACNRRVLSLPKNKRSGNHGHITVGCNLHLSLLRSM